MHDVMKYWMILLIAFSLSCKKESSEPATNAKLAGKWQLISEYGGVVGIYVPPANTIHHLTFSSNNAFESALNGKVQTQGNYKVGMVKDVHSGYMANALSFNGGKLKVFSINADTLSISDNFTNGVASNYIKVP
jgi:hypothetical protein